VLDGRVLADGQFSFQLYDAQGAPVGEAVTNNAAGSVTFPGITYTQDDFADVKPAADGSRTKQFTYTAKELAGKQLGYTYASTTATYTVTAVDRDGSITATVDAAQNATFTNTYTATSVTAAPFTTVKTLEGRALAAGEFTFQLVDEAGDVVRTATNAADGTVAFAPITYTQEDLALATSKTFTYTLSEVGNGVGGVTYDTATHTVSVTVTDNGDGTLSVSDPVYDTQQAPKFANMYKVAPAAIALPTATKTVSGDESDAYPTFTFAVEALDGAPAPEGADGVVLTRTLEGPGTVDFGSITFADEGTYRYRISETAGDADGWAYDATVYTVTYRVIDAGDGTFAVERSIVKDASGEAADAIAFQNDYTAPAAPDDPATPDESKTEVATTPATGDGLPIALLVGLMAAAGVAAVGAAKRSQAHAISARGRGAHRR
jgi:pilin isopeptide linkage protein